MQEGYEVHVSVPDTGYLEKIKKEIIIFNLLFVSIVGTFAYENIWKDSVIVGTLLVLIDNRYYTDKQ